MAETIAERLAAAQRRMVARVESEGRAFTDRELSTYESLETARTRSERETRIRKLDRAMRIGEWLRRHSQ